jgi:hypothetical protein
MFLSPIKKILSQLAPMPSRAAEKTANHKRFIIWYSKAGNGTIDEY